MSKLEDAEQKRVVKWLRDRRIPHFAVPNDQGKNKAYGLAQWRKSMGLLSGTPDLVLIRLAPCNGKPTALEMKRKKGGKVSDNQLKVHAVMETELWNVLVGNGSDEATMLLRLLGYE